MVGDPVKKMQKMHSGQKFSPNGTLGIGLEFILKETVRESGPDVGFGNAILFVPVGSGPFQSTGAVEVRRAFVGFYVLSRRPWTCCYSRGCPHDIFLLASATLLGFVG
jgi:hypothetical protein